MSYASHSRAHARAAAPRPPLVTGSLCDSCDAKCCRYYALEIDAPESRKDFDDLRWFIAHADTVLYVEDGDWCLHVENRCLQLDEQNRCRIYGRRPVMCREHSTRDCEYGEPWSYDLKFTTLEELELYIDARYARAAAPEA